VIRSTAERVERIVVVLAAIGMVAFLGQLLSGCGGAALDASYETLAQIGHGLRDVEDAVGDSQARERAAVVAARVPQSEARRRLSPYWRIETADRGLRRLLFAAERALDAKGADGFAEIAPCVAASVAELAEGLTVLREIGANIPEWPWLATVQAALSAYGTQCGGE
jgi:hypothetical protein